MKIAIFGATSQIAKDLIISFSEHDEFDLTLFGRNASAIRDWLARSGIVGGVEVNSYDNFVHSKKFDCIINFIGVGDPGKAISMSSSILDLTHEFDTYIINYLNVNSNCRYIFLSSGAAYGQNFEKPVEYDSKAIYSINSNQFDSWYGVAKMYAEFRHRSLSELGIVDVRIFNYFSHTQDIFGRFFITDILRSVINNNIFITSPENIVRDFLNPIDFYRLIKSILNSPKVNLALDCYSKGPIDKFTLLNFLSHKYNLKYKVERSDCLLSPTGEKKYYFSNNRVAESLGYFPKYTALEGVDIEFANFIHKFM